MRRKLHSVHHQFKIQLMLGANFENILNPVDEQYREKMSKMKTDRVDEASHTEKIKTDVM